MKNQFLERYKKLGQELDPSNIILPTTIRINTLKIEEKELIKRLKAKKIQLEKVEEIATKKGRKANKNSNDKTP